MAISVWVLSSEINEYDATPVMLCIFSKKPSLKTLAEYLSKNRPLFTDDVMGAVALLEHILQGGGRRGTEQQWYTLEKVETIDG